MTLPTAPPKDATIVFGRQEPEEWSLPCLWETWYWGDDDYLPNYHYQGGFVDAEEEELDPNDWDVWRYATRKDMRALWDTQDALEYHTECVSTHPKLVRKSLDRKEN